MNTVVNTINAAGQAFIDFALPMLIQSGVLVLILLLIDLTLRRRVRAVFRYWIWMLVLLKLVLPPSLCSPVSFGTWFGETLETPTAVLQETPAPQAPEPAPAWQPQTPLGDGALLSTPIAKGFALDVATPVVTPPAPVPTPQPEYDAVKPTVAPAPTQPAATLNWQALVLLAWAATVLALLLLLLQRAFFVRGLIAQAQEAPSKLLVALDACRSRVGLAGPAALRISPNATSPAVCGLLRPMILIPKSLAPKLQEHDLEAVLLHELAHIKRGDLWVNLIQTLLQIVYFYNPLLWLANLMIRRIREQAVDEAVLVAMGETAGDYPETLLNVAKLAFRKRPTLSLRLIGVVESKSALTARIKHILSRPFPKTAKLGCLGLIAIFLIAAFLLPMASARPMANRARNTMTLAREEARRLNHSYIATEHILLALARQEAAVSARVFANLGIDIETLRTEVNKFVQPGPEPVTKRTLPHTPRAQRVMKYAREEAKTLGHDYIGTEHLLLGLMREKEGIAVQVLTNLGLTWQQIRTETLKFVEAGGKPPADPGISDDTADASGGRVLTTNSQGIAGATLQFRRDRGQEETLATVTTDTTGRFIVPPITRDESVEIAMSAPGFHSQRFFFLRRGDGTHVPEDLTFTLKRVGAIEGQVIGPDGTPLANAPLSLTTSGDFGLVTNDLRAITDEFGRFQIENVPPGTHLLYYPWSGPNQGEVDSGRWQAYHEPNERWPSAPGKDVLGAAIVALDEGEERGDVLVDLSKSTCVIEGHVRDATGRLVAGAKVDLFWKLPNAQGPWMGEGYSPAVSDSEGRYRLANLPPGDWHIGVQHSEIKRRVESVPIYLEQGETLKEDLRLPEPVTNEEDTSRGATTLPPDLGPLGEYALSFDGVDDCLIAPANPSLTLKPPFSIEMWIKPHFSDTPGEERPYMSLVRKRKLAAPERGGYVALTGSSPELGTPCWANLYYAYGGGKLAQTGRFVADGQILDHPGWFHLSVDITREDYVIAPDHPLVIGDRASPDGASFKGEIAEIRIWNRTLTDEETRYYADIPLTGNEPGLVACWDFERSPGGQIVYDISPNANHARLGRSIAADDDDPTWLDLHVPQEVSGQILDSNGVPVAGAQVALCTKDQGVTISDGRLDVNRMGGGGTTLVETDDQGRFSFADEPEAFHIVAAHEKGFAWVTNEEFAALPEVKLQRWGRIEGTLHIGRERGAEKRMGLLNYINKNAIDQRISYDYEAYTDPNGRFVFEKVPPGWAEVGYLIRVGGPSFPTSTYTARTPLQILPGQTVRVPIGGRGRPVVGKFVPQTGYDGPVYFGAGLRALDTVRPERPTPDNYEQMTKREQQEWYKQWRDTSEAQAYYDTLWHDPQRRHYSFRIQEDGTFRIEDVIPGKYKFTVWLEERFTGQGQPEEIGAYYGSVEVPEMDEAYSDKPLDLGELTVQMRTPLHVGDTAPLFEAKTLDGNDVRLADYRGKFVLLSFWQPASHPELDRLKELHATYGGIGRLQIIGLGGSDTLEEVKKRVAEHKPEWPQIYFGEQWDQGIAQQYSLRGLPYILLIDPQGQIVATWLRGEKLTDTVREALGKTD